MTPHLLLDIAQWLIIVYLVFWRGRTYLHPQDDPNRIDISKRRGFHERDFHDR